jgi:DNA-binding response OmpR family regulator
MYISIIEDDDNKASQLMQYLHILLPNSNISVSKSFHAGLKEILNHDIDLVLLDMTMPTFDIGLDEDGGRIQHLAGRELLFQMQRRNIIIPVIIITQFDQFGTSKNSLTLHDLDIQLRQSLSSIYKGYVFYNTAQEGWKLSLKKLISNILHL